jgi:uncharacterized protein YggE
MTGDRRISVVASGESSVAPDVALVSLSVSANGRKLDGPRDHVNRRTSAVLAALRDLEIADLDLEAAGLSIQPEYDHARGVRLVGYRVSRRVTARIRDLDRLGSALDAVVAAGANEVHGVQMSASDSSAAEHEALRAAVSAARAKAAAIADEAGVALGPLIEVDEEPDQHGPPIPRVRAMAMETAGVPTEVAAGELTVTRRIRASFEIG